MELVDGVGMLSNVVSQQRHYMDIQVSEHLFSSLPQLDLLNLDVPTGILRKYLYPPKVLEKHLSALQPSQSGQSKDTWRV